MEAKWALSGAINQKHNGNDYILKNSSIWLKSGWQPLGSACLPGTWLGPRENKI
jgi:hypothetical protein